MARWAVAQLTALCTVLSFFYISASLERHSLTQRPRLSSLLVLLLSGCFCFSASFLSKWLPGSDGRFTKTRRQSRSSALLAVAPEEGLLEGWHSHMPDRPRRFSLPLLIFFIVVRMEVFHRVNYWQQCSSPGIESFLCLLLVGYEIFTSRRKWGYPLLEDDGDPWRSMWDDLYDWFSGPRVTMCMTAVSTFMLSLGTFFSVRQFTRSTYFCFPLADSRSATLLLQATGLALDAAVTVVFWRLLAWTQTTKLRLRTLGTVLTLSSLCMGLVSMGSMLYSSSYKIDVPFGSLYAFDVVVDSVAFGCLMISAAFWICDASPLTPAVIITCLVGISSSGGDLKHLGDWEHLSKSSILVPLWVICLGAILFAYCHDLRSILFMRRILAVALLLALLISATAFTANTPHRIFDKRHPISDLVYRANIEHGRWLKQVSASKELRVAVATYQERHEGRNPPPGFREWYNFARESIVIDDYPQIDRDMAPFWNVPPQTLRQRVDVMASQPNMATITIRDRKVTRSDTGDRGKNQDLDEVVDLIRAFSRHVPDMVLPINLSPTPQILPSWEEAHSRNRADLSSLAALVSRRSLEDTNHTVESIEARDIHADASAPPPEFMSAADFRQMQMEACPPGSPAKTDSDWNTMAFCSDCARRHSRGQALMNWGQSLETCSQPDLAHLHGFSLTNPRSPPLRHLLPLFSASKTDQFSDIIIPLPRTRLEEPDIKWGFNRRYDSLIWRGSVRGQGLNAQALQGSHKFRLLHLITKPAHGDEVTMVLPVPGRKNKFAYERVPTEEANRVVPFNVGLEGFSECAGSQCELVRQAYGERDEGEQILEYRYVLLLDEDDGPPAQMMRTLRSGSVPLVSTVFRTWYTDRLMPWLHFVPIDPRYQGLHSAYAFFTGTERRPMVNGREAKMKARLEDAEWIARAGQKWANTALAEREMQVYLFRLLLEWARLLDDGRDKIGTWREANGGLHDSGWTSGQGEEPSS